MLFPPKFRCCKDEFAKLAASSLAPPSPNAFPWRSSCCKVEFFFKPDANILTPSTPILFLERLRCCSVEFPKLAPTAIAASSPILLHSRLRYCKELCSKLTAIARAPSSQMALKPRFKCFSGTNIFFRLIARALAPTGPILLFSTLRSSTQDLLKYVHKSSVLSSSKFLPFKCNFTKV
eukprot:Lithocolla_globosa_v1_NODE_120_length_6112_cov_229.957240.p2 type:complete len:178 gc:universal NODE_120_length_6112_cov_229.957240:1972-1439(-)